MTVKFTVSALVVSCTERTITSVLPTDRALTATSSSRAFAGLNRPPTDTTAGSTTS